MNILVGMSGGVDSSAAALLLKRQGHDVTGITMSIWDGGEAVTSKKNACYGPDEKEDIAQARAVAGELGIPYRVFDCAGDYRDTVIRYFRDEYRAGRTPNPCVMCNHKIKFGALLDAAGKSGLMYDKFATGHYARVVFDDAAEKFRLMKGRDYKKDQSYFLHRLTQRQLSKAVFPLGELTKSEVRTLCREAGLAVSDKEESQDFYSGDYRELIGAGAQAGDIVTADGQVLGTHTGLWNFTPGQRRGIGVTSDAPLYVVKLDAEKNQVIVGKKNNVLRDSFSVSGISWISGEAHAQTFDAAVRVRHMQNVIGCRVTLSPNGDADVVLCSASGDVAPGQFAVFYDGEYVLGGGVIR